MPAAVQSKPAQIPPGASSVLGFVVRAGAVGRGHRVGLLDIIDAAGLTRYRMCPSYVRMLASRLAELATSLGAAPDISLAAVEPAEITPAPAPAPPAKAARTRVAADQSEAAWARYCHEDIGLEALAAEIGMSPHGLRGRWQREHGDRIVAEVGRAHRQCGRGLSAVARRCRMLDRIQSALAAAIDAEKADGPIFKPNGRLF